MQETGASDLLLTAGTVPHLRINGALEPVGTDVLSPEDTARLTHDILNERQLTDLAETKSIDFSRGFEGLSRFRMNVYYQRGSIALAIRIIPFVVPPFEDLGLPEIVRDFASHPHGLVLITGSAGSGKSTTMAAMIDYINNSRGVHIVCIEDPIEYLHTHRRCVIDQREIHGDARSFDEALRSVFRQSPDVIMIGEMRDLETMQLCLTLAETGHLILATLHTQDTVHAISRLVDSFPPAQQQQIYVQLSMVLVGVISQQLIVAKDRSRLLMASEILTVNNAIRNLIREGELQQIYSVIQTGRAQGMQTMNDSLFQMVEQDLIDTNSALKRSPRPKELARMLTPKGR